MLIEDWDREAIGSQESIFGRRKASGAPLSGGDETTPLDLGAMVDGAPVIDPAAHVRLAHPDANDGIRILRRGYNYVDGVDADGRLDAGLLFISFQRSPSGFIAIQRRLADDKLAKYIRHLGSAVFAMPPGTTRGGFVGETLFA